MNDALLSANQVCLPIMLLTLQVFTLLPFVCNAFIVQGHGGAVRSIPTLRLAEKEAESDILNSPAFLQRKLEILESDIEKEEQAMEDAKQRLESGKEEWGPQLDELQKEYFNIQDRMKSQNNEKDDKATTAVARQMLDVLDNFDRAFGAVAAESEEQQAVEAAYKEAYQMVLDTFAELGVEEVKTVGVEFDYEVHQAVMQRPSEEYEEGIVCEELQKGFKIGDTLIRAAMVSVAA